MPPLAREKARLAILDTLGVTIAGSVHPATQRLANVVLATAAPGPAAVIGTAQRINVLDAAELNGMAAHVLDYDDSNSQLLGHPSVAVLPATLAAAEECGASGAELVQAYVVGFETAARMGLGVSRFQYTHGFHPTATVGIFGAVAGAGVILGLDEGQLAHALGIAASMAAGVKSNFGSMVKALHVAQAGRNALLAVRLAREGFTAGQYAFEHPAGYLNAYDRDAENYDIDKIVAGWGEPYCIIDWGIKQKRFAVCYACLAPIDGILDIAARGVEPRDVERIDVRVHPIRVPHIDVPDPASGLAAKFSVHYCVARALIAGTLTIEDFEGDRYADPAVRALMERVTFGAYEGDNIAGAEVRVRTKDGRTFEAFVDAALGANYQHALTDAMVREKFEDCAERALGREQTAVLYDKLRALDDIDDVTALTAIAARPELIGR